MKGVSEERLLVGSWPQPWRPLLRRLLPPDLLEGGLLVRDLADVEALPEGGVRHALL